MRFKQTATLTVAIGFVAFGALPYLGAAPVHAQKMSGNRVTYSQAKLSLSPISGYKEQKAKTGQAQQAVFVYIGPVSGKFASNVNLMTQAAPPGLKADAASAESLAKGLKGVYPTYKKVGTGTLMVGGDKAAYVSGTFAAKGFTIQNKQVIVVHGGTGYIFTFTADPAAFNKQVGAFDKMVASVKWM